MSTFSIPRVAIVAAGLLVLPAVAEAQQGTQSRPDSAPKAPANLQAVTVTATRRPTDVRDVPVAVSVVDSATIRERMPNSAADLLRELPGLDVVGTGPNQVRPAIRGQRGQRILLMQDGLRLNNSRRQQDFGELPALVDVADIERVEIVRGPSSVLYGSDAIGGVINLITPAPRPTGETTVRGIAGYQYGGAGNQRRVNGRVTATAGAFAFSASGATRDASNYRAPSGSFGDLTLGNAVELQDSGVRDESLQLYAGWRGSAGHGAWVRQELYGARDAGFGFVEPRVLGDTSTRIALTYPWQSVRKTTAGFNSGALRLPFADKLDVSGYTQRNARDFNSAVDVFIPTGPGRTATIQSRSFNYTDVRSHGFRAEASKVFAPVTVTYGADFVYDDTRNRDSSWSRTVGFGPFPVVSSNTNSTTPNAIMRNLGLFAQGDWRVIDRLSVITGVRYHDVHAETKGVVANAARAPQEANNRTSVYAVNALYRVTDNVRVVASHGRGFRAPNLIERYFSGPSTDGTAIQIANPALRPEQSRNVDVGVRVTNARVTAELFAFQSDITDGIIVRPTGRTFGRQAEFQNINVEKLETTGYEASLGVEVGRGVSVTGNYTKIDTKNPATPDVPVAGTYNSRLNVSLGYRPASGRFWTEYVVRHHGRQQDINLGTSPVGAVVPSFTVMHWRGGVRVASFGGRTQELTVALNNLGNVLYAEAANTAFFRPEPARHVVVGVRAAF